MKEKTIKKILIVIALLSPVIVLFLLISFILILVALPEPTTTKTEPLTGLEYEIKVKHLNDENFSLIVKEVDKNNISDKSKTQTNQNGIEYYSTRSTRCYEEFESSLDPEANKGKKEILCVDVNGSQQDNYYVFVEDKLYLFTTPFPTRIIAHDPSFGFLPERISQSDFEELIMSLR